MEEVQEIRKLGRRGYDIIRDRFFVEEIVSKGVYTGYTENEVTYFNDFESYSAFVDNEIYDNACYYQCDISKIKGNVDYGKLYGQKSFVEDTIDDYTALPTAKDIVLYEQREQEKEKYKVWIDKFNACSTADEFRKAVRNYTESKSSTITGPFERGYKGFLMWQYIFSALDDKDRFNILMEYMSD